MDDNTGVPQTDPIAELERPLTPGRGNALYGSDAIADALSALDVPYIALNPGASYRGLHDSIVNYLGNAKPQMLLCLHEEHAVAIAHGWAKVTGKPMAVAVHSNVGLMHASMAIFNAWCDRRPVIVLGATGPVDAAKRRPWIDWIHTARDQGALVRHFTKWDDQPSSAGAARESILRAGWMASTAPMGPVYINFDAGLQEERLAEPLPPIDAKRFMPPVTFGAPAALLDQAAEWLAGAKKLVILVGRVSRSEKGWQNRRELAETLNARVATDIKQAAGFAQDDARHLGTPGSFPSAEAQAALKEADVILSLDWNDLGGALRVSCGGQPKGRVISVSTDFTIHNGWSMDYQALPVADLMLAADPDETVAALLERLPNRKQPAAMAAPACAPFVPESGQIRVNQLAHALRCVTVDDAVSLLHVSLSWDGACWPFRHPLDYLGGDGGGGIGAGPGTSVGAALALRDTGRLPIAVCGDGDFMMGATAIWTAVHYKIPMLIVVANNQSFYNDEVHQERVAQMRNRPPENKWIGQRVGEPAIDIAGVARAQGATAFGPVMEEADLIGVFTKAVAALKAGEVVVVDVRIRTGYTPAMAAALTRSE